MNAPIVLFVYNRLKHTRLTVEALQKNELANQSELFIYSDAAKNKNEQFEVNNVRKYIDNIDYIYTEVNTEKVYKNCALMSEIDDFLKEKGFERKCEAIYKQYGWGDAFYMRV